MYAGLSLALTALVMLCFREGQRALISVVFGLTHAALFPNPDLRALARAALPFGVVLAPLLPVSRWLDGRRAVAVVAGVAVLAPVGFTPPAPAARAASAVLAVGSAALFLVAAVGHIGPRSVAAGAATAMVLGQLLDLAGWSYDPVLRPTGLPVQLVLSAAGLGSLGLWLLLPEEERGADALERRAGGLRLRGALALGGILFLESNVLGSAAVGSRWTGVPYPVLAVLLVLAGVVAVGLLVAWRGPPGRHRPAAVAMAGLATAAALVARTADGWGPGLLFAAGHGAAVVLFGRALTPASGRRGGWTLTVGLCALVLLDALFASTFFHAFTLPALRDAGPWILLAAGALIAVSLAMVPRPPSTPPLTRRRGPLGLALAGVVGVAAGLAWRGSRAQAVPPEVAREPPATVRVATYNVRLGFGEGWRYDPEAIARAIEASRADVIALQEVPAGLPVAYETDLALWLGRRLAMRSLFAPTADGLLGDAFLTRLPVLDFASRPLPPEEADRKQIARLVLLAGNDTLTVYGTRLGLTAEEQDVQLEAVLRFAGDAGPAVLAGDLNAGPASEVVRRLRAAGFRDAFELAGAIPQPTAPAHHPSRRIDWIWVRGYATTAARVLHHTASDHRPVVAELRITREP